jgi:hypothetical protein
MWQVVVRCRQNVGLVALALIALVGAGATSDSEPAGAAPMAPPQAATPDCAICWD